MDIIPEPASVRPEWTFSDLVVFGTFFVLTLLVLPGVIVSILGIFIRGLSVEHISGVVQFLIQGVLTLTWVGFIVFLIRVVHQRPVRESLHWFPSRTHGVVRLIFLGITLAVIALLVTARFPPDKATPIEKLVETPGSLYLLIVFGIFFAPITEEIMFRGFLFGVFSALGGKRLAIPGTALLFALVHAPQLAGSWAGIVLIFIVGYVLSIIRQRSNSIVPSFIVHTAYNSMLFGAGALSALLQRGQH
jgi:membrane protease YdiL (CAAX protease family)